MIPYTYVETTYHIKCDFCKSVAGEPKKYKSENEARYIAAKLGFIQTIQGKDICEKCLRNHQ